MKQKVWDKVLFKKQIDDDSHVESDCFLKELKRNLHTPTYTIGELIEASQVVLRPFSWVCLYLCFYAYLNESSTNPFLLCGINISIFILLASLSSQDTMEFFIRPSVFLHAFLTGVAPILSTLTQSISCDTLWAMIVCMLFVHLIFYSYAPKQSLLYNAISLNAVIFAAVCLASMMKSPSEGFTLVSAAVHMFVFSPQFDKYIFSTNVLLVSCTAALLMSLLPVASIAYLSAVISITVVFPLWLRNLQHIKNNIYGPWDEAVV